MSTKLNDLPAQAVLGLTIPPAVATTSQTGTSIDLVNADGSGFAILTVGAIAAGTTVSGKVQESDDGTTFADIAGATFTTVSTANAIRTIRFERAKRYARCTLTIAGSSPSAGICATIGEQKKVL